jgi:large subunit ribosomal protein L15
MAEPKPKPETEEAKETKKPAASAKSAEGKDASTNAERIGLHNLSPADGSRSNRKRVGRGHGSGHGKTSGRGHKGAGQRAGRKRNVAYEGGQTPIQMRMRKLRGPHMKKSMPFEKFRTHTQQVNVSDLEERFAAGSEVNPETLKANGLAKRPLPVKILGNGEITKSLKVTAHGFSASAREKIEGAGGSCETIEG